eukprot:CAMPEP_0177199460 /NCGR_PEP_ID=MMETSP0367-20130122/25687_1 /TAXON_ID=447022 ORGANISM="Scrippsiella hangoei-like, Strain SHHI-4" /NCGR_SAMPLE_ID=MMETSP0367 /ASSEMBLY_ACC=CAM_ASM_000362 /LENGTH=86 /DNA_ID=CAMNT_0018647813 /DNA_START=72 /DNA_END=332 /DNA_ORIENTATION=-
MAPEASKPLVQYDKDAVPGIEVTTSQTCNSFRRPISRADADSTWLSSVDSACTEATSMDTTSATCQASLATAFLVLGLVAMGFSIF